MATKKAAKAAKSAVRQISVLVNGQTVGTIPNSANVGAAAVQIAKEHGLRAYSIKLNGKKLSSSTDVANMPLGRAHTIELFAKDARG